MLFIRARNDKHLRLEDAKRRNICYLQCSFSSRFPRDVTDRARINSSNSMEPSCKKKAKNYFKFNQIAKKHLPLGYANNIQIIKQLNGNVFTFKG